MRPLLAQRDESDVLATDATETMVGGQSIGTRMTIVCFPMKVHGSHWALEYAGMQVPDIERPGGENFATFFLARDSDQKIRMIYTTRWFHATLIGCFKHV